MNEEAKDIPLKAIPSGDNRHRIYPSIKLWVVNRSWSKDKQRIVVCGVMGSIERIVFPLEGEQGKWVRYEGSYRPLHSKDEFSELLKNAKKHQVEFFNNVLHGHRDATSHTELAPFIYCDENRHFFDCKSDLPSVFRLPRGGFHATSFPGNGALSQSLMNCTGDL